MHVPRVLRPLIGRALGRPPVAPVGLRAADLGVADRVAHGAVELGLRTGEALLSLGAPAADVTLAIQRVLVSFGLTGCHVDLTFTAITLSYDRGVHAPPLTVMRVVGDRVPDYGRLARITALVDGLAQGRHAAPSGGRTAARPEGEAAGDGAVGPEGGVGPDGGAAAVDRLEAAHADLDRIVREPHPYRRWVVTAMLALLAGGVAVLLGGGLPVALAAAGTSALIDRTVWALARWGLPTFFVQAGGAAVATLVAVGLFLVVPHLPFELALLPPSLVVASGIVVLLAGLSLVGAAEDAISGFPVTAAARSFEVLVLTLGIVVGIGGVLDVARRMGVPLEIIDTPGGAHPLVVQVAAAGVVAAAWAGASYASRRALALAGIAGATAWLVLTALQQVGLGPAVASAAAALVVGVVGQGVGQRAGVPSIVTSVCGIIPLLPGLAIYRALFVLVNEPNGLVEGVGGLIGAAMVGLGLAAGVSLGEFLAAPRRHAPRRRRVLTAVTRRRPAAEGPAADASAG